MNASIQTWGPLPGMIRGMLIPAYRCGKRLEHIQQGYAIDEAVERIHFLACCVHSPLEDLQECRSSLSVVRVLPKHLSLTNDILCHITPLMNVRLFRHAVSIGQDRALYRHEQTDAAHSGGVGRTVEVHRWNTSQQGA